MAIPFLPALDTPWVEGVVLRNVTDTSGVDCGAIFGGFTPGDHYGQEPTMRFVLWRVWNPDKLPLVIVGLNPSKATHLTLDNTVRRDLRYARDWGYGGLVKLNLHALRSTDPAAIYHHEPNIATATGGVDNDDYLKFYTDPKRCGLILCAWGTHGALYDRGDTVAAMLRSLGRQLFVLRLTKGGHPAHTLYLPANLRPIAW